MQTRIGAIGLCLTTLLLAIAEESPEQDGRVEVRGCSNGPLNVIVNIDGRYSRGELIPFEQIASTPSWNPSNNEEIPLSATEAFRLATSEFQRHFADRKNLFLTEISLSPLCDDRWVYSFQFESTRGESGFVLVNVLMSGKVVPLDTAIPGSNPSSGLITTTGEKAENATAEESPEQARRVEAGECNKFAFARAEIDGNSRTHRVPFEQIASTPSWNPSNGEEIPLTATEAFRLANSEFQRRFGHLENWAPGRLTLRSLCDDRWVYFFQFESRTRGEAGLVQMFVLMSGEVVTAEAGESPEQARREEVRGCNRFPVRSEAWVNGRYSKGKEVAFEQIAASSPPWNPSNGEEIPLSVTEVFRLAISEFQRHFGESERRALLTLMPLCDDRWVYAFMFGPGKGKTDFASVYVLMSGEVVPLDTAVPGSNPTSGLLTTTGKEADGATAAESPEQVPGAPEQCMAFSVVRIDGRQSDVTVPLRQIMSTPPWNPSNGDEAPLSVTKAFQLANSEFQRHFGHRENWTLDLLNLRHLCDDRWAYFFQFNPLTGAEAGSVLLVVLMSGEVVPLPVPGR